MLVLEGLSTPRAGNGALCCITQNEAWTSPPVGAWQVGPADNPAVVTAIATTTSSGNTVTFTVAGDVTRLTEIERDGVRYTLAADATNPQQGEFTFNSETGQVTVYLQAAVPDGSTFVVSTIVESIMAADPLITSTAALPDIFTRYELKGTIEWSEEFEGHPSGSFELVCSWAAADALKTELRPRTDYREGTKLTLWGLGFEVTGLTVIKESPLGNPAREATVKVSLGGMWEWHTGQAIVLDSLADTASVGSRTIRGDTTVGAIALKVGAVANVPSVPLYAPKKAGSAEIISLGEVIDGNSRIFGSFIDYSRFDEIRAVRLDSVPVHTIMYTDIISEALEISVNAHPRAFDYENSKLEWGGKAKAKDAGEDVQGKEQEKQPPRWRLKPPKREITITGSRNLGQPASIKDPKNLLSMMFDNGGTTREQETVFTEAGVTVSSRKVKVGFAGTAHQHLYVRNGSGWSPRGAAALLGLWQIVEQTDSTYTYNDTTGYLASIVTRGWRLVRYKTEGNNETLDAYVAYEKAQQGGSADKQTATRKKLEAYEYTKEPIYEITTYTVAPLRNHYNDIPKAPTEDYTYEIPQFLPDGSRNPAMFSGDGTKVENFTKNGQPWLRITTKVEVPGWTDPQYCQLEDSEKTCFKSTPDPDSTPKKPLPDWVCGDSKEVEQAIYIPDYRSRPLKSAPASGTVVEAEAFIQHEKIFSQKDAQFGRGAMESTQQQSKGRPGEHTRKVPEYEKIDPEQDGAKNTTVDREEFDTRISTVPIRDLRLDGDGADYPYARTMEEALIAAQCDAEIRNSQETETLSIEVSWLVGMAIRSGDLVNLEEHGLWRVFRIPGKTAEIKAPGMAQPGNVTLDLGRRIVCPHITLERRPLPKEPASDTATSQPPAFAAGAGGIMNTLPSRGNPTGG